MSLVKAMRRTISLSPVSKANANSIGGCSSTRWQYLSTVPRSDGGEEWIMMNDADSAALSHAQTSGADCATLTILDCTWQCDMKTWRMHPVDGTGVSEWPTSAYISVRRMPLHF